MRRRLRAQLRNVLTPWHNGLEVHDRVGEGIAIEGLPSDLESRKEEAGHGAGRSGMRDEGLIPCVSGLSKRIGRHCEGYSEKLDQSLSDRHRTSETRLTSPERCLDFACSPL